MKFTGLLVLIAAAAATPTMAAAQKMAFIDSRLIVSRAPGTAAAEQALQREGEALQGRVKVWQDSLAAMLEGYRKVEASLTSAQKEAQQKKIDDQRLEFARRADSLDSQMQTRQQELSAPIMAQIREVLDAIRAEDGYSFIFDVSQGGFIVAADKNLDITEKVIGRLKPIPIAAKVDTSKAAGVRPQPAGVRRPPLE
ncbi:MAG: OmpH family outer membrane protein [Gemmatimonadota bacterium]